MARTKVTGVGLKDLAGRTKDLFDEINTADLVVMIAGAGEDAHAASIIGEASERTSAAAPWAVYSSIM